MAPSLDTSAMAAKRWPFHPRAGHRCHAAIGDAIGLMRAHRCSPLDGRKAVVRGVPPLVVQAIQASRSTDAGSTPTLSLAKNDPATSLSRQDAVRARRPARAQPPTRMRERGQGVLRAAEALTKPRFLRMCRAWGSPPSPSSSQPTATSCLRLVGVWASGVRGGTNASAILRSIDENSRTGAGWSRATGSLTRWPSEPR